MCPSTSQCQANSSRSLQVLFSKLLIIGIMVRHISGMISKNDRISIKFHIDHTHSILQLQTYLPLSIGWSAVGRVLTLKPSIIFNPTQYLWNCETKFQKFSHPLHVLSFLMEFFKDLSYVMLVFQPVAHYAMGSLSSSGGLIWQDRFTKGANLVMQNLDNTQRPCHLWLESLNSHWSTGHTWTWQPPFQISEAYMDEFQAVFEISEAYVTWYVMHVFQEIDQLPLSQPLHWVINDVCWQRCVITIETGLLSC